MCWETKNSNENDNDLLYKANDQQPNSDTQNLLYCKMHLWCDQYEKNDHRKVIINAFHERFKNDLILIF